MVLERLSMLIHNDDVTFDRLANGQIQGSARYCYMGGKRYTAKGLADFIRNEIFRKGSRPHLRTRSPRWRAGTRRTKKYARAAR